MQASRQRRALVTGGAGLVGSNLVDDLLAAGWEVRSLDDYSAGKAVHYEVARTYQDFEEITADITNPAAVDAAMEGVDVVFHQAVSKNTICMTDPNRDLAVNAGGTLNLLLAGKEHGISKFVHASTGSVYGRTTVFPTTETAPLEPVSYYGVSKLAAERYVHAFHTLHGMNVTILRYYHVFGPRQDEGDDGGVVAIFVRRCLEGLAPIIYGDGTQIRAFTFVKDVTAINLAAVDNPNSNGRVYNCASDNRISIKDLADRVIAGLGLEDITPSYEDWRMGDIKHFDIDNRRVKDELKFDFSWSFEDGLDRTIDYLKSQLLAS
jgi:nucleoside-diphosphate-sugar epimerase